MIIIGAKGHAKEIIEIIHGLYNADELFFFDNISVDLPELLYGQFKIIRNFDEVKKIFATNIEFALGIGNPIHRYNLAKQFEQLGGKIKSIISKQALIGHYNVILEEGLNIMPNVVIYNDVHIGKYTLLNTACTIHHDVEIGNCCEISPGARILGRAKIGSQCSIGSNAVIMPDKIIENNSIVGAGAVVTKNIPKGETWIGVPAKMFK